MSSPSTRQRLTQSALELFLSQGISHTTTRQIANMAEVNEATLFRNFGNKYGLLLAILQEAPALDLQITQLYGEPQSDSLRAYVGNCLSLLEQFPNFVRSLIGEADQYPPEHQQALQHRVSEIRQTMTQHLKQLLGDGTPSAEELANILASLVVGYGVIEATGGQPLWQERDDFLDSLVLVLTRVQGSTTELSRDAFDEPAIAHPTSQPRVADLPASWVHFMMKQARNLGHQDYALALVLFGAGLLPREIIHLQRSHQICDKTQHILQVVNPSRQVPVNQWILGKRYGSYSNNPLTKWLKLRKDDKAAMFINDADEPMTAAAIHDRWNLWWEGLEIGGIRPHPVHAQQTWCVEMLMRGISLENLSILTGSEQTDLEPYAQRAREKSAIAAATQLDRKKPGS